MRVKTKLLLLMAGLAVCYALVLGAVIAQQAWAARVLAGGRNTELRAVVHTYFEQVAAALPMALAADYSRWDEMVEYARGRGSDKAWADEELPGALETFDTDFIWVYDVDFNLLWSAHRGAEPEAGVPAAPEQLARAYQERQAPTFYTRLGSELVLVLGQPIVPSADLDRTSPPAGYFLVGRAQDAVTYQRVGRTLGGTVGIREPEGLDAATSAESRDAGVFEYHEPLHGIEGPPIATRVVRIPSAQVRQAFATTRVFLAVATAAGILLVVLTSWHLTRLVGSPLSALSDSLALGDSEAIEPYLDDRAEIGDIARLVQASFEHTAALNEEIEERRRVELALAASRERLSLKAQISEVLLTAGSDSAMCAGVITILARALDSGAGMIGYVDHDGYLVWPAPEGDDGAPPDGRIPPDDWWGPWGEALRGRECVCRNEPSPAPQHHIAIDNALCCPIVNGPRLVGVVMLANRPGGYGEEHCRLLEEVAGEISPIFQVRIEREWAERRRGEAQLELELQREQLQTVIHSLPVGILLVDAETHTIADANNAACELIGASAEVLAGAVCHEYVCPAREGLCPVTDLGISVDRSESEILRVDRTRVPVIKSAVEVALGDRTYLLESFLDITELKRVQSALQLSEAEAQQLAAQLQAENERMRRELETASEVQRRTLPERCLAHGLRIGHHFRPSGRIGGDFFGVIEGPGGSSLVYVGDVSGHGLASALVVNLIVGVMEEVIDPDRHSPAAALSALQARLYRRLDAIGHYATLLLCRYSGRGDEIEYANAGHPWPILAAADGAASLEGESGLPLGWEEAESYTDHRVALGASGTLVLYSDGVSEARLPDSSERLGAEPLEQWLRDLWDAEPEQVVEGIARRTLDTVAGVLEDDLTLLALRLAGSGPGAP